MVRPSVLRVGFIVIIFMAIFPVAYTTVWPRMVERIWPVSDWFQPIELTIPGHGVGEDPFITYKRTVRQDFIAAWSVEVIRVSDVGTAYVCSWYGQHVYSKGDYAEAMRLSRFIAPNCELPPATYKVVLSWRIFRDGFPDAILKIESNIFKVFVPSISPS